MNLRVKQDEVGKWYALERLRDDGKWAHVFCIVCVKSWWGSLKRRVRFCA